MTSSELIYVSKWLIFLNCAISWKENLLMPERFQIIRDNLNFSFSIAFTFSTSLVTDQFKSSSCGFPKLNQAQFDQKLWASRSFYVKNNSNPSHFLHFEDKSYHVA